MKINKITATLIGLGLVSFAGAALADSTVTISGNQYTEVFITGSTAARGTVFHAVDTAHSSGGVFDSVPTFILPGGPGTPTTSTGAYTAYGTIGGTRYCLCFSWTGSEAGLWAIQHNSGGIPNPILANTLNGNPAYPNAVIPGTPAPTSFVDPNTYASFSANADLSMADTSQAVSLSPSPALHDFGIVGAVTFEWVKGNESSPDQAWNDLVNVTDPQLNYLLGSPQSASFFTGVDADSSDLVFAVGRNKASGTHQNTMIDTQHGTTTLVDQYVVNNSGYSSSGQLTNGVVESVSTAGGISEVFNDGFDSGGGVAAELSCDTHGSQNVYSGGSIEVNTPIILLGYAGISDANTAITASGSDAKALTLNGVPENDATVIHGAYSFWGHEHLYGEVNPDSSVIAVGQALAGTTVITGFGSGTPNGALEAAGQEGGGEAVSAQATTQSTIISPQYMQADKPEGSDSGYPSQI